MGRMKTGQRIDLHDLRIAGRIAPQIDPTGVTAADGAPRRNRDPFGISNLSAGRPYESELAEPFAELLIHIRIDVRLSVILQNDFKRADRLGVLTLADDTNRKLTSR